ncbi:MAG: hypothetical protein MSG64_17005 [Pyrinomonadaceae bacterium MAG19_C2-C3]|nr:hypothetical protein [Pyrinomonadaceae bacterium MAG19_C2-C3]
MNDTHDSSTTNDAPLPALDYEHARLAFSIIQVLLETNDATGDLVALMAQALDEDTKHALTNTPVWTNYLDSRRALHAAQADMEKFSEAMNKLEEA